MLDEVSWSDMEPAAITGVLVKGVGVEGPQSLAGAAGTFRGGANHAGGGRARQLQNDGQHKAGREARRAG